MLKLERRARICLLIAGILFLGMVFFTFKYVREGGDWAGFYGNTQIYTAGEINRGEISDRHDNILLSCSKDGVKYDEDPDVRAGTIFAVGDTKGNISTGAINMWKSELIGYDLLNGTYDKSQGGKKLKLSIDAGASKVAYNSLNGREGFIGVFNYKTGEIMTLVNSPAIDPLGDIPQNPDSPVFFNTFMLGKLTPGSTFKLVTSVAAIRNMDTDAFSFKCDGINNFHGINIRCTGNHGNVDFEEALVKSCNGAYGEISRTVGSKNLKAAAKDAGLMDSIDVDGIHSEKGSFDFPNNDDIQLSWAGIGQHKDLVNPCSMMVFVGAIANDGKAVNPTMIDKTNFFKKKKGGKIIGEYISPDIANKIKSMMKSTVEDNYGSSRFSGLDIYAKSGTAETGGKNSDSWFVGFLGDEAHPYAFVTWVKGGGTGYITAGEVANDTLQALVSNN